MRVGLYLVKPKLDRQLVVPISREHQARLLKEARAAGYRSLAAYVRDYKLHTEEKASA